MKSTKIIKMLKNKDYDKLLAEAEREFSLDLAKQKGGNVQIRRQRAIEKYL